MTKFSKYNAEQMIASLLQKEPWVFNDIHIHSNPESSVQIHAEHVTSRLS